MPARGETYISGIRSLKLDLPVGEKQPVREFSVDWLWRQLGLDAVDATSPRQHSGADGQASAAVPDEAPAAAQQRPQSNPNEDAGATALHARQQAATTHHAPTTPNWNQLFAAACGNRTKLEALRNQGKQMGLPETYGMFAAIEAELKAITEAEQADNVMEGTLV